MDSRKVSQRSTSDLSATTPADLIIGPEVPRVKTFIFNRTEECQRPPHDDP
jgi:hypothetical protein